MRVIRLMSTRSSTLSSRWPADSSSTVRVRTALAHREPDRVPVDLHNFQPAAKAMGISMADVFQNGELLAEAMMKAWRKFGHDMILLENGTACNAQACGMKVTYRDDMAPAAHDPIIRSLAEVANLEVPDPYTTFPMNEILMYDTSQVEADLYLQTHTTNPLLRQETVSRAIQTLLASYPAYDSLFSVTRLQTRLWDALGRAINHNPAILLQTQDLPPVYEENSCMYIFSRETLLKRRNRLGERPLMFEIEAAEAWDIDEELDFAITDFLMKR